MYSRQRTEEQKRREEEKARRLAEETERKKRLKEGLSYAKFIFEWTDEFRKNEDGKRIIKIGERTFFGGVMFFDYHLYGKAWRGLGVSKNGVWWIRGGCGAYPVDVQSPEELAAEIDTAILSTSCESIKNGKVWECIKNRWEINPK